MIELAFTIAMTVQFLHATTEEGMIFQKVPEWLWNAPVWIKKPLYSCPICMSVWYGMLVLLFWPPIGFLQSIMTLFVAGGINVFASSFLKPDVDADSNPGGIQ